MASLLILIFNDFGLLKLFKLQHQHKKLEDSLTILLLNQENLKLEINQLQTNNEYIEKIARENVDIEALGMYTLGKLRNEMSSWK